MRGCKPDEFTLNKKDVSTLLHLLRDGHTRQRVAHRARILRARANGRRVTQVALQVDQNASTVWRVCERYGQRGLAAAL